MKFAIWRMVDAGLAPGGMTPGNIVSDDISLFAWPIKCAGIRMRLGDTTVDITRDEAAEIASYLQLALRDG